MYLLGLSLKTVNLETSQTRDRRKDHIAEEDIASINVSLGVAIPPLTGRAGVGHSLRRMLAAKMFAKIGMKPCTGRR